MVPDASKYDHSYDRSLLVQHLLMRLRCPSYAARHFPVENRVTMPSVLGATRNPSLVFWLAKAGNGTQYRRRHEQS